MHKFEIVFKVTVRMGPQQTFFNLVDNELIPTQAQSFKEYYKIHTISETNTEAEAMAKKEFKNRVSSKKFFKYISQTRLSSKVSYEIWTLETYEIVRTHSLSFNKMEMINFNLLKKEIVDA